MEAETASTETEPAADTIALTERLVPPLDANQRAFRIALVVALLFHASFFIHIGRSVPRSIGDPSGAPDAISVDLVTEADLRSRETVAMPPAGAPAPPPAPEPQPQDQPETPTPEPVPEPQPKAEAAAPAPKEPVPTEKPQEKAVLPDFESVIQDLATAPMPSEEAKPEPPKPQEEAKAEPKEDPKPVEKKEASPPPKKKAQQQARVDPQRDLMNAPPGLSAAATRPPGITRSGENDEFGRAVIRALRQTMPPPRGIFGRVTVRLILTENGDLGEVNVLSASGTSLDQSVVFATKQTYFPLPPYNATVADRTFVITYVYR